MILYSPCPSLFQILFLFLRTFKPKIEFLQKTGFRGPLLQQLLKGCPSIIELSKRQLQRRWNFLNAVAGASLEEVAAEPQVLLFQVDTESSPSRELIPQN